MSFVATVHEACTTRNTETINGRGTYCAYWTNGIGDKFVGSKYNILLNPTGVRYLPKTVFFFRVQLPGELGSLHQLKRRETQMQPGNEENLQTLLFCKWDSSLCSVFFNPLFRWSRKLSKEKVFWLFVRPSQLQQSRSFST